MQHSGNSDARAKQARFFSAHSRVHMATITTQPVTTVHRAVTHAHSKHPIKSTAGCTDLIVFLLQMCICHNKTQREGGFFLRMRPLESSHQRQIRSMAPRYINSTVEVVFSSGEMEWIKT